MVTSADQVYPLVVLEDTLHTFQRDFDLALANGTGLYVNENVAALYSGKLGDVEVIARVDRTPRVTGTDGGPRDPALFDKVVNLPKQLLKEAQDFVDHPPAVVYSGDARTRYQSSEPRWPYDLLLQAGDTTLEWPRDVGPFFVVIVRQGRVVALVRDRVRSGIVA